MEGFYNNKNQRESFIGEKGSEKREGKRYKWGLREKKVKFKEMKCK